MSLKQPQEKRTLPTSIVSNMMSLGTNMAVGMAVFAGIGYWIDQKKGNTGIWTLGGIFLGLFYGAYEAWKIIVKINKEEEAQSKK